MLIALMADRRSCLSQACWTGVWPRGAQVRRRVGWKKTPVSSENTMLACQRAPPFYSRPFFVAPLADGPFSSLASQLFGLLATPAQARQQMPDMTGMVSHAKSTLDHFRHSPTGPHLGGVTRSERAVTQDSHQLLLLVAGQSRPCSTVGLGPQRSQASRAESFPPPRNRRRRSTNDPRHLIHVKLST